MRVHELTTLLWLRACTRQLRSLTAVFRLRQCNRNELKLLTTIFWLRAVNRFDIHGLLLKYRQRLQTFNTNASAPLTNVPDENGEEIKWPTITKDPLRFVVSSNEMRLGDKKVTVVDVREPFELDHGMLPRAIHIPLDQIQAALSMPPEDFKIKYNATKPQKEGEILVYYCRTGKRALTAMRVGDALGYKGLVYEGSYVDWFGKTYEVPF